ncbi:Pre-rRNA-processing protein fhl1 [Quaeritorhiza haematococci]|nr:Pre-rRNA-processing protein fhl1 [Quaeritorhiza haematococci]
MAEIFTDDTVFAATIAFGDSDVPLLSPATWSPSSSTVQTPLSEQIDFDLAEPFHPFIQISSGAIEPYDPSAYKPIPHNPTPATPPSPPVPTEEEKGNPFSHKKRKELKINTFQSATLRQDEQKQQELMGETGNTNTVRNVDEDVNGEDEACKSQTQIPSEENAASMAKEVDISSPYIQRSTSADHVATGQKRSCTTAESPKFTQMGQSAESRKGKSVKSREVRQHQPRKRPRLAPSRKAGQPTLTVRTDILGLAPLRVGPITSSSDGVPSTSSPHASFSSQVTNSDSPVSPDSLRGQADTPQCQSSPSDLQSSSPESYVRPKLPYAELIKEALTSSETGALSLKEIYEAVKRRHPYFRHADPAWQNSIRHNLCVKTTFRKIPRPPHLRGKGYLWTINNDLCPSQPARKTYPRRGKDSKQSSVVSSNSSPTKDGDVSKRDNKDALAQKEVSERKGRTPPAGKDSSKGSEGESRIESPAVPSTNTHLRPVLPDPCMEGGASLVVDKKNGGMEGTAFDQALGSHDKPLDTPMSADSISPTDNFFKSLPFPHPCVDNFFSPISAIETPFSSAVATSDSLYVTGPPFTQAQPLSINATSAPATLASFVEMDEKTQALFDGDHFEFSEWCRYETSEVEAINPSTTVTATPTTNALVDLKDGEHMTWNSNQVGAMNCQEQNVNCLRHAPSLN